MSSTETHQRALSSRNIFVFYSTDKHWCSVQSKKVPVEWCSRHYWRHSRRHPAILSTDGIHTAPPSAVNLVVPHNQFNHLTRSRLTGVACWRFRIARSVVKKTHHLVFDRTGCVPLHLVSIQSLSGLIYLAKMKVALALSFIVSAAAFSQVRTSECPHLPD